MKTRIGTIFVILTALLIIQPAHAGGWAVVTLDDVITQAKTDQTFELGFWIWAHGKTPIDGLSPSVIATHSDGTSSRINAREGTAIGHYIAEIQLPKAGEWTILIDPQPYPILESTPQLNIAVTSPGAQQSATKLWSSLGVLGIAILASIWVLRPRRTDKLAVSYE